jgi:type VI secretion system secreted protein Hcp
MAMMQLHMKVDGIDGPCRMKGREGTFEVLGLSHEVVLPFEQRNGKPRDKRVHNPVTVLKEVDSASPKLYQAICTAQKLRSVEIKWYRQDPDGGKEQHYFTTKLGTARLVSIAPKMDGVNDSSNAGKPHTEQLRFIYEEITWTDVPSGASAVDKWEEPA